MDEQYELTPIEGAFAVSHRHRVFFTRDCWASDHPLLARLLAEAHCPRVLVTLDAGLHRANPALAERIQQYLDRLPGPTRPAGPPLILPAGEQAKNDPSVLHRVWEAIAEAGICRHSCVVAVGGGAHLDLVGFAAATAHRGVRHIRVPSTTLAQADSGVGVKNAVNALGQKNFVGTFAPPLAVVNDFALLDSLPPCEKRAGLAEAVKVALIRDRAFFEWLEAQADALARAHGPALEQAIHRCAELHIRHIVDGGDPFETGSARPLDFGHWSAHKLEVLSGHRLGHGQAVAIGVALDTWISALRGDLTDSEAGRVVRLLERLGFKLWTDELAETDPSTGRLVIHQGLEEFRAHLGGRLTLTMLTGLGRAREIHELAPELVAEAVRRLRERRVASAPA
ncbi:MAG: 3-dehydroquinate synthase [Verrucomicrobia bacterium]|nr:MAG: 3-dehydroquinate synthase [Verrucomicrobiota bacterium]